MEDSDSGSSVDLNEMSEAAQKRMAQIDGQVIYLNVFVASKNKQFGLQGTTLDDPASLARNFAYEHNLGLVEQIKLKKLV
mgnify:CR=1 FL=1